MMDIDYHMEDPLLKERDTVGSSITSKVFAGCSASDDGDTVRSNGTDVHIPAVGCFTVNRRKRKMLQPKRAAMYGSETAEGVWCDGTDESQCCRPRPVKQQIEVPHTPLVTSRRVSAALKPVAAPAASKTTRPVSSAATKCSKKYCTPVCGPCGNCGTTTSPQWRHGNDDKPIVCNACGIRYQRTGSFEKAMQSGQKRGASSGSGAVSGGAQCAKRCKTDSRPTPSGDTCSADSSPEAVSRPASRPTSDSRKRRRSSPTDAVLSNAGSPSASPSVTPLAADTASTPASPLRLDSPCANNAAGSSTYAANHYTHAEQQHVPTPRGRRSQSGSRLRPSPLSRVNVPAEPPASDAPVPGQPTAHPALVPVGQVISGTAPFSAGPPVASIPSTAVASGPTNNTAAGTAAAQAGIQPELLQLLDILAPRMGSIDAAIAYMMASAGGIAASGMVVPVAGVPGQVLAHIQW